MATLDELLEQRGFHIVKNGNQDRIVGEYNDIKSKEENPSLVLSDDWNYIYNFKTNSSISTNKFLDQLGLTTEFEPSEAAHRVRQTQKERRDCANNMWIGAEQIDIRKPSTQPCIAAQVYLNEHRKIPLSTIKRYTDNGDIRYNQTSECSELVIPIFSKFMVKEYYEKTTSDRPQVRKINRIRLDPNDFKKLDKKQLGSYDNEIGITMFQPFDGNCSSSSYLVCEGLENALSLMDLKHEWRGHWLVITNGTGGFKQLKDWFNLKHKVTIVSDLDDQAGKQSGQAQTSALAKHLTEKYVPCDLWMPKMEKMDANDALKQKMLFEHAFVKIDAEEVHVPTSDFITYNDKGNPSINVALAARSYIDRNKDTMMMVNNTPWNYADGCWNNKDADLDIEIQSMLSSVEEAMPLIKSALVNDIETQVRRSQSIVHKKGFNINPNLINMKNGTFNTSTGKLQEHKSDDFMITQTDYDFDVGAECPRFLSFLEEVGLTEKQIQGLQEWFGYCFVPKVQIEKCLYLYGPGSNGKSVLCDVLRALVGNATDIDLHRLCEDKNLKDKLEGTLVNISSDLSMRGDLQEEFKALVSGEPFFLRLPYEKHGREYKPFTKFTFAANNFPTTRDKSTAFFRRFFIIEMKKVFKGEEVDRNLKSHLVENELPGIFNWAMEGLKRLRENKWQLTECESSNLTLKTFEMHANPLLGFIDENCELDPKAETLCDDFVRAFHEWSTFNGHTKWSATRITQYLQNNKPISKRRMRVEGLRQYMYKGIKLYAPEDVIA